MRPNCMKPLKRPKLKHVSPGDGAGAEAPVCDAVSVLSNSGDIPISHRTEWFSLAKISIIGTGLVGATSAYALLLSGVADELLLIDINEQRAHGEMLDLTHSMPLCPPAKVSCGTWSDLTGSDVVILAAGANQRPGQTRLDLTRKNVEIFRDIVPRAVRYCPEAVYLVVTNPVDVLTHETVRISGLPPQRVLGSGTVLDTSRLKNLLSGQLHVDPRNIHAWVLGEHGDSEFPAWSLTNVAGMPLEAFCEAMGGSKAELTPRLQQLFDEHVKNVAYTIIAEKGATYYAVAVAVRRIVEAILRNERSILSVSTRIDGPFGLHDVCLSLPTVVGKHGAEQLLPIRLTAAEEAQLQASARQLKSAFEPQFS